MNGIIKGNKHSYRDFNITIAKRDIGIPKKNKITEKIPFSNITYDFSTLYVEQTYNERALSYTFNIIGKSKSDMNIKKANVLAWLMDGGKEEFYDDTIPGVYFLAEVVEASWKENLHDGQLTVKLEAYPFKISSYYEGDISWDELIFELDVLQETKFDINGYKNINLYNNGVNRIIPQIICDSVMEITINNSTYKLNIGENKDNRIYLNKGPNSIMVNGNGNIEFRFRKELL
ncbi:hypothetical protein [Turicibacter sanguinis]|uniref:hypothetical protein n=1 Tax=Turicibacter sanguinis TaxID=154288 RepID=UPI0024203002|nr:hypothetical protein [Turicibacter sanguinis]